MPQSTILNHFSPSGKYPKSSPSAGPSTVPTSAGKRRVAVLSSSDSDSEGSEGIEGIQLSAKGDKRVAASLTQKRAAKRVVQDDEESEGEAGARDGADGSPKSSKARAPAVLEIMDEDPDDADVVVAKTVAAKPTSLEPPAASVTEPRVLRRSGRRPASLIIPPPSFRQKGPSSSTSARTKSTPTTGTSTSRSKLLSVELPVLNSEQRALYSPWGSQASGSRSAATATSARIEPVIVSSDDDDNVPIVVQRKPPPRATFANARSKRIKERKRADKATDTSGSSPSEEVPKAKHAKRPRKAVRLAASPDASPPQRTGKERKRKQEIKNRKEMQRAKRKQARDPDDTDEAESLEEEDMVAELQMDEPDRFKSDTRLRKRSETTFQRSIRKAKNKRLGIIEDTTSESDDGTDESGSGTGNEDSQDEESEDFIEDDGGEVPDQLLPHQFSLNSAQTPEFKFKVVFHYLLYLVMNGPKVLPLQGEIKEYFEPQLQDVRRRLEGFKNGRVRSQIWPMKLVTALDTYPDFEKSVDNGDPVYHCDACNRRLPSRFQVTLGGDPYDRDTHQALDDSSSNSSSDSERSKQDSNDSDQQFTMGRFCQRRAKVYHAMSHWEDDMYDRIRVHYHDLLRAQGDKIPDDSEASSSDDGMGSDPEATQSRRDERTERRARTKIRVERLKKQRLPSDMSNVDKVLIRMDEKKFQTKLFHILEDLVESSRRLEHDNSRDE